MNSIDYSLIIMNNKINERSLNNRNNNKNKNNDNKLGV